MVKFLLAKEKTRVRFPLSAVAYVLNTKVIIYLYYKYNIKKKIVKIVNKVYIYFYFIKK